MKAEELEYELPPERIAQEPLLRREDARLLAVNRETRERRHLSIRDFPDLLNPGDLLVLNDTRVLPARLHATRESGGAVRLLLLDLPESGPARAMVKASGRLRDGEILALVGSDRALRVVRKQDEDLPLVEPEGGLCWGSVLEEAGRPPLPPYIRRPFDPDPRLAQDRERYQTVFARIPGSIAAPTAGLHLTGRLLDELGSKEIGIAWTTLHVGPGTFKPVKAEDLGDHAMEAEWCVVPQETAFSVNETRARGSRVVAVGTTVVRALESASRSGVLGPFEGETELFIRPPFEFRAVDALLTNFHLPRSTLIALVAAFAGLDLVKEVYCEAVEKEYRFYSYGDACFFHLAN